MSTIHPLSLVTRKTNRTYRIENSSPSTPSIHSFPFFSFFLLSFHVSSLRTSFLLRRDLVSKFSASSCNNAWSRFFGGVASVWHPFIANNRGRVQPTGSETFPLSRAASNAISSRQLCVEERSELTLLYKQSRQRRNGS